MLKRISTQQLFMALSKDEVSLNINNKDNPAVISIVNHPKYESAYCAYHRCNYAHSDQANERERSTVVFFNDGRSPNHQTIKYALYSSYAAKL